MDSQIKDPITGLQDDEGLNRTGMILTNHFGKIVTGLALVAAIGSSFYPSESEMKLAAAKKLASTKAEITFDVSSQIDFSKKEIMKYSECERQLQEVAEFNESMTLERFMSGETLKQSIDCSNLIFEPIMTPAIMEIVPNSSTGTMEATAWTSTGGKAPVPSRTLKPEELFYVTAVADGCHISQVEEEHFKKRNGSVLATDVSCRFGTDRSKRASVFAPDYLGKSIDYEVIKVSSDPLLWNYVELRHWSLKWVISHLETKLKVGDSVPTGWRIGQQDLSWATTGYHSHVELWKLIDDAWTNVSYSTRSIAIANRRSAKLDDTVNVGDKVYATQYDLGDVSQNDASPFIGASGKDLRHVGNPIALTVDVRKAYGLSFGDKVKLSGPCSGTYSVEDEMNIRFRTSCIRKQGSCVKMDIAVKPGEKKSCEGEYLISKL